MTPAPWVFIAVGAGLVLVLVLMVAVSVSLIVHSHEVRELRFDAEWHAEVKNQLDDLRRLTLNAINGRAELIRDMSGLKIKVSELDARMVERERA